MAKDPDNLVLVQLREIRSEMSRMNAKLEAHDKRFDKIDERFDGLDYKLTHVFGFAAMASLGAKHAETKVSGLADRQAKLETEVTAIDQRLRAVENPADS
jgi:serine/threonine protein kinase HipA of HipAB toxin-antitoxin module